MNDELDPALRALLDAERAAPLAGAAEAKAQILAKVLAAGAAAGGAATGAAGTAAGAGTWSTKALLLVALGAGGLGAVGGSVATIAVISQPEPAPTNTGPDERESAEPNGTEPSQLDGPTRESGASDEVPEQGPSEAPDEQSAPETGSNTGQLAPSVAMGREAESEGSEPTLAPPTSTLAAERALIDQALSALRARRAQDALVALMAHERRFGSGALAEERDRLSVEALVQLGREDQALRRAELFEARYPGSAHLPRIRSLIGE